MPTYLRGFLPSLGAGGSLVGAALVVAAILSSVIAFQGWPVPTPGADGGSVTLSGPAPAAAPTQTAPIARTTGVATPAAPAVRRRGATRRGTASGPTARLRGSGPVAPRTAPASSSPAAPAPSRPTATRPAPSAGGGTSSTSPSRPSRPGPVTTGTDAVQQAIPPAPPAVQPVVDTVNQVVDDTAATVDDAVGGLVP